MSWFIKHTLLLFVVCIGLNFWYSRTAFLEYADREAPQYLQMKKIAKSDLGYFSESSNFSPVSANDVDKRKLSQFLNDMLPGVLVEAVNQPAGHAGIYRKLLTLLPDDAYTHTIVVAVNLRSFGPSWIHSDLETALSKAAVMYNTRPPLLNRLLVSLGAYDHLPPEEREEMRYKQWQEDSLPLPPPRHTVHSWTALEKWGDWTHPKRQLADHFIKQFGFVVNDENPRVKDFDEIVRIAGSANRRLIYVILPENLSLADSLVGSDLTQIMRSNANWIATRYRSRNVEVLNLIDLLPDSCFPDRDFPTEHYNEYGRKLIASILADRINQNKKL